MTYLVTLAHHRRQLALVNNVRLASLQR